MESALKFGCKIEDAETISLDTGSTTSSSCTLSKERLNAHQGAQKCFHKRGKFFVPFNILTHN